MANTYSPAVKAAVTEETARLWAISGNAEQQRRALSLIRRKPNRFVEEVIAECRGRCFAVEAGIQADPYWACIYAKEVIGGRFVAAEPSIAMDPVNSCKYAEEVLRGEFELGEKTIATNAAATVRYATFLRKRFPSGEKGVFHDRKRTDEYFRIVIRTPDKDLEQVLLDFPRAASQYAQLVLQGRWKEAEAVIQQDLSGLLDYARFALRGPLPEDLHDYMVSNGLVAEAEDRVKQYLAFCERGYGAKK